MDIAGPKLRTGPLEPGPQVVVWHPTRDSFGRVTETRANLAYFCAAGPPYSLGCRRRIAGASAVA